jgi:hypothetical protein
MTCVFVGADNGVAEAWLKLSAVPGDEVQKQIAEVAQALYQRTDELAVLIARRSPAVVGAEALPRIACALSSIDVYSA